MDKKLKMSSLIKGVFEKDPNKTVTYYQTGVNYSPKEEVSVRDICTELEMLTKVDPASLQQFIKTEAKHIKNCTVCSEVVEAVQAWTDSM